MLNFVYLRTSRLKVLNFWLDSCIANKGDKFELEMVCWMHLEGFQVVSSHFWALGCTPIWPVEVTGLTSQSAGPVLMLHTGLTGGVDQSDRSGLSCCSYHVSSGVLHAFVQRELHWLRGGLHVCRGSSLWFFELLVWWFALYAWALFCLGCVEPLPLPKRSETCLLHVILLFAYVWLSIAC
jgi:hypothetical protein